MRAQNLSALGLWSIKDIFLIVNGGSALMLAFPNLFGNTKTPFERFIDTLSFRITEGNKKTEEQEKIRSMSVRYSLLALNGCYPALLRIKEEVAKSNAVLDATIRDRIPDMIFAELVATEPASQERGYGGALLEAMNDIADERDNAMWLTSSNVLNDTFYNSHGFMTVGTYYLGEGNPTWTQKPIPVQIVKHY